MDARELRGADAFVDIQQQEVRWPMIFKAVKVVVQTDSVHEETRTALKNWLKCSSPVLVLTSLTLIHTISINCSANVRAFFAGPKWVNRYEKQLSKYSSTPSPACAGTAQLLVDWAFAFSHEELGQRSRAILQSPRLRGAEEVRPSTAIVSYAEELRAGIPPVGPRKGEDLVKAFASVDGPHLNVPGTAASSSAAALARNSSGQWVLACQALSALPSVPAAGDIVLEQVTPAKVPKMLQRMREDAAQLCSATASFKQTLAGGRQGDISAKLDLGYLAAQRCIDWRSKIQELTQTMQDEASISQLLSSTDIINAALHPWQQAASKDLFRSMGIASTSGRPPALHATTTGRDSTGVSVASNRNAATLAASAAAAIARRRTDTGSGRGATQPPPPAAAPASALTTAIKPDIDDLLFNVPAGYSSSDHPLATTSSPLPTAVPAPSTSWHGFGGNPPPAGRQLTHAPSAGGLQQPPYHQPLSMFSGTAHPPTDMVALAPAAVLRPPMPASMANGPTTSAAAQRSSAGDVASARGVSSVSRAALPIASIDPFASAALAVPAHPPDGGGSSSGGIPSGVHNPFVSGTGLMPLASNPFRSGHAAALQSQPSPTAPYQVTAWASSPGAASPSGQAPHGFAPEPLLQPLWQQQQQAQQPSSSSSQQQQVTSQVASAHVAARDGPARPVRPSLRAASEPTPLPVSSDGCWANFNASVITTTAFDPTSAGSSHSLSRGGGAGSGVAAPSPAAAAQDLTWHAQFDSVAASLQACAHGGHGPCDADGTGHSAVGNVTLATAIAEFRSLFASLSRQHTAALEAQEARHRAELSTVKTQALQRIREIMTQTAAAACATHNPQQHQQQHHARAHDGPMAKGDAAQALDGQNGRLNYANRGHAGSIDILGM